MALNYLVEPALATIAAIAAILKFRQLRRLPGNPGIRATCIILAALAGSVLIGWGPIYVGVDRAVGVPNLSRYLEHVVGLVAAAAVQDLFLHLGNPRQGAHRARVRWYILAVVAAVMAVLFSLGNFDVEAPEDFADVYAGTAGLALYNVPFLLFMTLAMTDIFRMSTRYSRQLPRSPLRFGIRLLAIGSVNGLLYVAHKAAFVVLTQAGVNLPWPEWVVSRPLVIIGVILAAGGLVIPAVGSTALGRYPRRYRLYRDLHPLWSAIVQVNTAVSLSPPARRPSVRAMEVALYRRVIEIRDGLREFSTYTDSRIASAAAGAAAAAGLDAHHARAVGEAAAIAQMLDYLGTTPPEQRAAVSERSSNGRSDNAAEEFDADARWLTDVSRAYATSPIVAEYRAGRSRSAG